MDSRFSLLVVPRVAGHSHGHRVRAIVGVAAELIRVAAENTDRRHHALIKPSAVCHDADVAKRHERVMDQGTLKQQQVVSARQRIKAERLPKMANAHPFTGAGLAPRRCRKMRVRRFRSHIP